jgi:hypothetical protein
MLASNMLPAVFLLFLILIAFAIPPIFYSFHSFRVHFGGLTILAWPVLTPRSEFRNILTWDFYALYLVGILAPILGTVVVRQLRFRERVQVLSWSTLLCYSVTPHSLYETIAFLFTRRAHFYVTGDRRAGTGRTRAMTAAGIVGAIWFLICGVLTVNCYLGAVGTAILLAAVLWPALDEGRPIPFTPAVIVVPLLLTVLAALFLGFGLASAQAGVVGTMPFHF